MFTIWKFPVQIAPQFELRMPRGAKLLDVQVQRGEPQLWAMVDSDRASVTRVLAMVGTGDCAATEHGVALGPYVGTFQSPDERFVFHLFDRGERF